MRVLAFSDLHRDQDAARAIVAASVEADVVIGAGDFATRREGLMERLDRSQDNEEMARCAAILIYQQVKSLPIAGMDTTNVVARLFEHDKKIPPEVTQDLLTLRTCDDSDAPMSLILRVKKYGSAKNAKALASLVDKEQH